MLKETDEYTIHGELFFKMQLIFLKIQAKNELKTLGNTRRPRKTSKMKLIPRIWL
jgi:hypothetical protein